MADLITNLPGILGDIANIINWCKEYYKNVRSATKAMQEILILLGSWVPQLELLEDLIRPDDNSAQSLRMMLANEGVLEQTRQCLQELNKLVTPESAVSTPSSNHRRRRLANLCETLTWPIMKQNKADELLRELETHKSTINMVLGTRNACVFKEIRAEVKQVASHITVQEKRAVLTWLQPEGIDSHEIHLEKSSLMEDETCDWMTRSDIWKTWTEGGSESENGYRRFLWIHGLPGSGKTILVSFLIDTIAKACKAKGCSYYYCSHQRGQDETRSFLQWVINDFCTQSNHCIPQELHNAYEQYRGNVRAVPIDCLLKCLLAITKNFGRQVYIIVDAADESLKPRNNFLKILTTIGTDPDFKHVSLLMTSRDEIDIRAAVVALPLLGSIESFLKSDHIPAPQIVPHRPIPRTPPRPQPNSAGIALFQRGNPSLDPSPCRSPNKRPQSPRPVNDDSLWLAQGSGDSSFISPQHGSRPSTPRPSTPGSSSPYSLTQETIHEFSAMEIDPAEPPTPTRPMHKKRTPRKSTQSPYREILVPEISKPNQAYTELSMDNQFVLKAIQTYVSRKLQAIDQLKYLRPEFLQEVEVKLAREARGMFRWVACQIDMIMLLDLSDEPAIENLLRNLPKTVFDTYERIIVEGIPYGDGRNEHNRTFARTALALICSNTSGIPSADVLVEASLFNVPRGVTHQFNIHRLEKILGCLIKVTRLNRKPPTVFRRDEDAAGGNRFRVAPAHYTVKEYLFHPDTAKGPAKDFALSSSTTQVLELEVVFNGLQQFGSNRPRGQRDPTRYEEYCLRMTDKALRLRRTLIVKERCIWEAVFPCLRPNSPHQEALRNQEIRQEFPRWAKLNSLFRVDKGAALPSRDETSILVSLLVLKWPELAAIYLRTLAPEDRAAIWTDRFTMTMAEAGRGRGGGGGGGGSNTQAAQSTTILQLSVSMRRLEFLEVLIEAGADFAHESEVLYAALRDPYAQQGDSPGRRPDDGATTGQLLKMVLQRGADPNPRGYRYTPLQAAVAHLEERWIQSLLIEHADPNAVGDPDGAHPYGDDAGGEGWFDAHALQICRDADPDWQEDNNVEVEEQIKHAKLRVEGLLVQYGARWP